MKYKKYQPIQHKPILGPCITRVSYIPKQRKNMKKLGKHVFVAASDWWKGTGGWYGKEVRIVANFHPTTVCLPILAL